MGMGGKAIQILSLEWNGAGLPCGADEFKLSRQCQAATEAFSIEK